MKLVALFLKSIIYLRKIVRETNGEGSIVKWRKYASLRSLFTGTIVTHLRAVPTFHIFYLFLYRLILTLCAYILRWKGERAMSFHQSSRPTSFNLLILNSIHNLFFFKVIKVFFLRTSCAITNFMSFFPIYMCICAEYIKS